MPARELFGSEVWDTFSKAARADAYALKPDSAGMIAGPTTFASSARRDAQALHRIWSFMQDHETFGTERPTNAPVPQYLIRYGRERKSVDLVFDIEGGYMSLYETGNAAGAKWLSIAPAVGPISEQLDQLFDKQRVRDFRPNL